MTSWAAFPVALLALVYRATVAGSVCRWTRASRPGPGRDLPGVTVLKPVSADDPRLLANLESHFQLDYPSLEIVLCFERAGTATESLARELASRYPHVPTRFFFEPARVGANPKINTLAPGYAAARHDWLLVTDADVRLAPDALTAWISETDESTGLVSAPPSRPAPRGMGEALDAQWWHHFYAPGMWLCAKAGEPCASAKCLLYRKSLLEEAGGLAAIADYHADDVRLGKLIQAHGGGVKISSRPVRTDSALSLRGFWARQLRWCRNRRQLVPGLFALELFLTPLVSSLLFAWAVGSHSLRDFAIGFFAFFSLCFALDMPLTLAFGQRIDWRYPLVWALNQLLHPLLWACGVSSSEVRWEHRRFRIDNQGRLLPRGGGA